MEEFKKILKVNQELDKVFDEKYSSDEHYYNKNCIALLVELGEFINETKCFKYWSIKKPNMDNVLEEYADCITMCLSFFTHLNVELDNIPNHSDIYDIFILINEIFKDATNMIENRNGDLIKKIFSNLLYLGEILKLDKNEIYNACYKKMRIIDERLNSDY